MRWIGFCCLFLLISHVGYAWNPEAHVVIAEIAYMRLTPPVRNKVDRMANDFKHAYPRYHSFIQLARWPDDIKGQKILKFSHWHYIDNPFSQDGTPLRNITDADNIIWALSHIECLLQNPQTDRYQRAIYLAFLIHCIGDLHQPLHTVSRISKKYPWGDHGGNLYRIHFHSKNTSLHPLWDSGFHLFKSIATPRAIHSMAEKITTDYPESYFGRPIHDLHFEDWENESMQIAIQFAYNTPPNQSPSTLYTQQGKKYVEQRIALSGYRLAAVLNTLLA